MDPDHLPEDTKPLQSLPTFLHGRSKSEAKVLCLKARVWWMTFLSLSALLFILEIGCLGSQNWMSTGTMEGGLLRCSDCPGAWNQSSYDEIANYLCEGGSDGMCDLFKSLRDAGVAYVFFELLSLVFLTVWAATIFSLLVNKELFAKLRWLPYVHLSLALFFHFLALVIWAGASAAKFDSDCPFTLTSSKPDVCAEEALALAIAVLLLYLVALVMFIVAFRKFRAISADPQGKQPEMQQESPYVNRPPGENADLPENGYPNIPPANFLGQQTPFYRDPAVPNQV